MDAIVLLKEQHENVKRLFTKIEQTEDKDEREAVFQLIADNLAAHALIEERIFYPAAYARQTKILLTEAVEEHLAIKRLIADLMAMTASDANYDAKIKVLAEQVKHHVKEEEGKLFPAATDQLSDDDLKLLGMDMRKLFDEVIEQEPSRYVPGQTSEAARLR